MTCRPPDALTPPVKMYTRRGRAGFSRVGGIPVQVRSGDFHLAAGAGPAPAPPESSGQRQGADSRAAPRGASGRAAGGAAVVLERLADRGAGVLRAAGPSPTDPTSPMRLVVDHAVRPSRLRSSTASPVRRPSPWPRGRSREPRRPAGGGLGMDSASRPSSRCGRSSSTATPATSPPSRTRARSRRRGRRGRR